MPQLETIRVQGQSGIISVPTCTGERAVSYDGYNLFSWGSQTLRILGYNGKGFIPLTLTMDDHALPIRVQTQDGVLACSDLCLDCLEITFADLAGALAVWNGAHTLVWESVGWPHRWDYWPVWGMVFVWCYNWIFQAGITAGGCVKRWIKSNCTPCGVYSEDIDTCGVSAGASCIVTVAECP